MPDRLCKRCCGGKPEPEVSKAPNVDYASLVGPTNETKRAHQRRHEGRAAAPPTMRQRRITHSKWARFAGQAFDLQPKDVEHHGRSDEHKRAERLFKQATLPASNSAAVCGPEESDDEEVELLRGAVP